MKSTRKGIVVMAIVLAVVFAGTSVVVARGFGGCGGGSCAGPGYGWGPGSGGPGSGGGPRSGGLGLGAIMGLKLSDSQRDQALKIMENHQIDGIKARGEMIKGRENLREALQADKVNEEGVRTAYKKLSSLREDRLIARAKAMTEIKAILTPEQAKLLEEGAAEQSDGPRSQRGYGRPYAGGGAANCPRR